MVSYMSRRILKKIEEMHSLFGTADGKCKDCSNFRRYNYRGKWYSKCRAYGISLSVATDWNGRNTACGLFNKDYNGTPIYKRHSRIDIPLDGQMSLLEIENERSI